MEELHDQAALHVTTRGLEDAVRNVVQELSQDERERFGRLGLTTETILSEAITEIDIITIADDIADRALALIDEDDENVDPIALVLPLVSQEHPFENEVRNLVKRRLEQAA